MMIKFFTSGTGGGAAPVDYLIAEQVLAYDENRNLIRDEHGTPQTIIRNPLPDVLRGTPNQTRDLIDASSNKWTYTAGVMSFEEHDQPTDEQQREAMDQFEEIAFAGLDAEQYNCLWVRHVHEGNVELHFCTPRLELTEGKSLNIAPPGHEKAFNGLRDMLNKEHVWADPLEPDRARDFKLVKESHERAEARSAIVAAIHDQIDLGLITDRPTMIEFFESTGFEVTRRAEKSLSVRDPEFTKPFKLEGVLTHEHWTAQRHQEIATHYQAGTDAGRTRRLDQFELGELRDQYNGHVETRAAYNRERYAILSQIHTKHAERSDGVDTLDGSILTLDSPTDHSDHDSRSDGDEPLLGREDATKRDDSIWFEQNHSQRANVSDFGHHEGDSQNLHDEQLSDHLPQDGTVDDDTKTTHSIGTRITWLRGAIDTSIDTFNQGSARLRETLSQTDERNAGLADRLRDVLSPITKAISKCADFIDERVRELRAGRREFSEELEQVADRRSAIEAKLEVIEHNQSYGLEL